MAKTIKRHFESFDSFVEYADKTPTVWGDSSKGQDEDFYGEEDFDAAVNLARYGWQAGRDKLQESVADAVKINQPTPMPSQVYDVGGAYPIVALAVAGDPCNMVDSVPVEDRTLPVIRLSVKACYNCMFSAAQVTNYGAALVSWIDRLEHGGQQVEIDLAFPNKASSYAKKQPNSLFTVNVKRAGEPLDLDRLAFVLMHPATNRRFKFACLEKDSRLEKGYSSGYGVSQEVAKKDREDGVIYLGGLKHGDESKWRTIPAAVKQFENQLINAAGQAGVNLTIDNGDNQLAA